MNCNNNPGVKEGRVGIGVFFQIEVIRLEVYSHHAIKEKDVGSFHIIIIEPL